MIQETFSILSSIVVIVGMAYLIKRNIENDNRCHCALYEEIKIEREQNVYKNTIRKREIIQRYSGIENYYSMLVEKGRISETQTVQSKHKILENELVV